jgi:hypothetical protein
VGRGDGGGGVDGGGGGGVMGAGSRDDPLCHRTCTNSM